MAQKKHVKIFFIVFILCVYAYSFLHTGLFDIKNNDVETVVFEKSKFYEMNDSAIDISNVEIFEDDDKTLTYIYHFNTKELKSLNLDEDQSGNIYLLIEKPDTQYMEVRINGYSLGFEGQSNGQASLWNGNYFFRCSKSLLQEENTLSIFMFSDYMRGVAGDVKWMTSESYQKINGHYALSETISELAVYVAFIIAVILLLLIIAWHKELYNLNVYIYFCIALVALGISLYDSQILRRIPVDFLVYKKIVITAYHVAILFTTLGVSSLLNARFKFNFAMISLGLILIRVFTTSTAIAWRESYQLINIMLIVTMVQLVVTLIYYRRRAAMSAMFMILATSLAGVSVLKMVYYTSTAKPVGTLIDLPIIVMMFSSVILFVFYNEMVQMTTDQAIDAEYQLSYSGSFTMDHTLSVIGQYSHSCNAIFDGLIIGKSLKSLMFPEQYDFVEDILKTILDPHYTFLDGFIALLPEETTIRGRRYKVFYQVIERAERFIKVTLNDVTELTSVEKALQDEKSQKMFFINALKAKDEVGFFLNHTRSFIDTLKEEGFTLEHQKTLHTLKGNLAQFGFSHFEKAVHHIEVEMVDQVNTDAWITSLEEGLLEAEALLEHYIGAEYFSNGYDVCSIDRHRVLELEAQCKDPALLQKIKELKYMDIKHMLQRYVEYVDRLALSLSKAVMPLTIEGDSLLIDPEKGEALVTTLVHLFKNCVAHGIEVPEMRIEADKDSHGVIQCLVEHLDEMMVLTIEDDGKGVDLDALRSNSSKHESDADLLQKIFDDHYTTKETLDEYSGKGVGLAVVKETIEALGGHIDVYSEHNKGTQFIIKIPVKHLLD